jgi:hypothetical protein
MSIDELKTDGTECCIGARLEWRCDHKQKRACTIFLVVQALFPFAAEILGLTWA